MKAIKYASAFLLLPVFLITMNACKPSGGSPPPAAGNYGVFYAIQVVADSLIYGPERDTGNGAYVFLYANPNDTSKKVLVDSITLNGVPLYADAANGDSVYTDFIPSLPYLGAGTQWVVKGNNGIPSFSYNDAGFPGYLSLPDTIDRTKTYTFYLNNTYAPGVDSMSLQLSAGSAGIIKSINSSAGSFSITPADFAGVPAINDYQFMIVSTFRNSTYTVNGQNFLFQKEGEQLKRVFVR